jgi:hypothetical protein
MTAVLGIRLNNPLNIKRTDPRTGWRGATLGVQHKTFESFVNPLYGFRAGARILVNYGRRNIANRIDTIAEAIAVWAPTAENNTALYAQLVAQWSGFPSNALIWLEDPEVLVRLLPAMARMEVGTIDWPAVLIEDAVRLAVTKES